MILPFLSTLSLRRATDTPVCKLSKSGISIHALLAESDLTVPDLGKRDIRISIHALLAESDITHMLPLAHVLIFLSTLSLRRATYWVGGYGTANNFYPRSPCGERQQKCTKQWGTFAHMKQFFGDCIFMLTGKAVFYPFCPCFFHIFWCE